MINKVQPKAFLTMRDSKPSMDKLEQPQTEDPDPEDDECVAEDVNANIPT